MIKIISLLFLLFSVINTSHADLLQSGFKVEYDVEYNGFGLGVSKRSLSFAPPQTAIYKSTTTPEGFAALLISETVTETSNIHISRNKIKPSLYRLVKNKKGNIEQLQIDFNWKATELNNSYLKTTEALQNNTYDLLSFQLKIMQDLQKNKTSMQYRIATKKHTRDYNLKVIKKETIDTGLGEFEVIKLQSDLTEGKSQFTFWAAPALEYLPIKIEKVNDKGDVFSFIIRAFTVQK
ncbi:hypothetical protein MNBD_GAMMA23-875 [hydrothermal vent metagenome]|uniref:DUF3108 domain-containing protein n=1 Tax=hydrothermal vent metagenome TaxID=652676 RepID=A0A3B1AHD0_9ZZZZ